MVVIDDMVVVVVVPNTPEVIVMIVEALLLVLVPTPPPMPVPVPVPVFVVVLIPVPMPVLLDVLVDIDIVEVVEPPLLPLFMEVDTLLVDMEDIELPVEVVVVYAVPPFIVVLEDEVMEDDHPYQLPPLPPFEVVCKLVEDFAVYGGSFQGFQFWPLCLVEALLVAELFQGFQTGSPGLVWVAEDFVDCVFQLPQAGSLPFLVYSIAVLVFQNGQLPQGWAGSC